MALVRFEVLSHDAVFELRLEDRLIRVRGGDVLNFDFDRPRASARLTLLTDPVPYRDPALACAAPPEPTPGPSGRKGVYVVVGGVEQRQSAVGLPDLDLSP